MTTFGPWYVGDTPTADIIATVTRDGSLVDLDGFYASAAVVVHDPVGAVVAWTVANIVADTVVIPPPALTPFTRAGTYPMFVKLTTPGGNVETFELGVVVVKATAGVPTPDVTAVRDYLGATSATDNDLQGALDAEAAAQARICRTSPVYPADLAEALKRRVARNLAMRGIPLAVPQGDPDLGPQILPGNDPEVRRLERPHRKVTVG